MNGFAGKTFVVRVDEATACAQNGTFIPDLGFLTKQGVRAIVVAPNREAASAIVRAMNRSGNAAVGLSGEDAALLPATGRSMGTVQTGILSTLTGAGRAICP